MTQTKQIPTFFHEYKGCAIPELDTASYRLVVEGKVEKRLEISLSELEHMGSASEIERRFYCVNGWSLSARWFGVEVRHLLEFVRPSPEAQFLRATSIGAYEDTSSIRELVDGRAMLVTRMNGEPLSPERGKPVRLMLFDRYQFRGVKSLAKIEIVSDYRPGMWVKYGYTDASIQPFPHLAIESGECLMPDPEVLKPEEPPS
ncbi:MAG TPA: molybdopterin-dependent oxidoreductase [Candidatus Angelobacter sp.]|jgi:DMSO/TMAO reductase YedYZ molybdopterin-dependent catalytic subunit